jgi:hypothetical protein
MKLRIAIALVSYVGYIKMMIWPHSMAPKILLWVLKKRLQLYQAGHPFRQQAYERIGFNNL